MQGRASRATPNKKPIRLDSKFQNSPNECALARAAFAAAIAEKPSVRFMIRQRIRVVKRHPEGDW